MDVVIVFVVDEDVVVVVVCQLQWIVEQGVDSGFVVVIESVVIVGIGCYSQIVVGVDFENL